MLIFLPFAASAQFDFPLNPGYCSNEKIELSVVDQPYEKIEWDFCVEKFSDLLAVDFVAGIPGGDRNLGADFIKIEDTWYAIVTSWSSNKLIRLTFGNGLDSAPTSISDLGNPGGLLDQPVSIGLVERDDIVYALVQNWGNSRLIRIEFTDGISGANRNADVAYAPYGASLSKMEIIDNESELKAIVITTDAAIQVVDFQNDINKNIVSGDVLQTTPLPGITGTREIEMVKDGGNWYAFIASFDGTIARVDFGANIMTGIKGSQLNVTSNIYGGDFVNNIEVIRNGSEFHLRVATFQGHLYKVNLGTDITVSGIASGAVQYGSATDYSQGYLMKFVRNESEWHGYIVNDLEGKLYRIHNTADCFASIDHAVSESTVVAYSASGNFPIGVVSYDLNGNIGSVTKSTAISSLQSPDINYASQNICKGFDVNFTSQNISGDIAGYEWDFGDSSPLSLVSNPAHQFSNSGEFDIRLEVTASNACKNSVTKSIRIYDPPTASFDIPPGPLCTNNQLTFESTTIDNFDGNLSYQWFVEGAPAGTNAEMDYTFVTTGLQSIKLITSIPGCSDEVTDNIPTLLAGPVVDFSFTGKCEDAPVLFLSSTSQVVSDYEWDFNDGASSTEQNPGHSFADPQNYSVTLSALSPNGCNNSKTKTVPIYTKPVVDFRVDPPPLSCSGSGTGFIDLTIDPIDSDLQSWQWNFGDPGSTNTSSQQNPSHIFANAGNYAVSLTITTTAGCSTEWQEQTTITQSPTATIGNSSACVGVPVNFSATGSDIKSYYWEMGTLYYEVANPVHTFNAPGNQPVKLTIQGNNNCITVYTRPVTVPVVLSPDFSVVDNCLGYDAVFTDITSGADPVVQRTWDFAGLGTSSDQPASFEFAATGNKNIKLTVTTQAGCSYTKTKTISVVAPPVAAFTASPESGGTPLLVQFTNASTGATHYAWSIAEESVFTTNVVSPSYTFTQTGAFLVTLAASGPQGCASVITKEINTIAGLPDVDLKLITTSENADGTIKVIITVQNKGNTILRNLPVVIDISGNVSLTETIAGPIGIASMYNLILSYGLIPDDDLQFLCAKTTLENDQTPEGNRICKEFDDGVFLFNAYPNPAKGEVTIEWIAPKDEVITISLVDSSGKKIVLLEVNSLEGLNSSRLSLDNIKNGLYILRIQGASLLKTQRIFVSGQN